MTWLWAALAAFATYYTALAIAEQDGPFEALKKLRRLLWAKHLDARGHFCVVCASAYTGAAWALFLALFGFYDVWLWPVVGFGLAGASVFINKVWKR